MGSRKREKPQPAPAPAVPEPFHAPFRDIAKVLKSRPRPQPAAARPPQRPASRDDAPPGDRAVSDTDALARSMQGVAPLAPSSPRVRIRRKVDLSRIESARREDVDAMARGDGFDVTFEDRYVRGRAYGVSRETLGRLEKGEFSICAHLDLHGLPLEDARREVDAFLAEQHKRGRRCVLLVTGKGKNSPGGNSVLREQVPRWLARGPSSRRVLAFASARPCDGGVGALVVLMRGGSSSKSRIDVEHGGVGPLED